MGFIKNYEELAKTPERIIILDLVEAAFASIQPEAVIAKNIRFENKILKIKDEVLDFSNFRKIYLLGFGKGSAHFCKLLENLIGDFVTEGFDIDVSADDFRKIQFTKGSHPLPSQVNLDFTKNVITKLGALSADDLVIIVTCGGGSALFELPNNISLGQLEKVGETLLKSGADIKHMNMIRKHLSKVKGGKLAKILYPAKVLNLIFSDVPGNDLSTIASGPLIKDDTKIEDAYEVFRECNLETVIKKEDLVETPKEDKYFEKIKNLLVLSNLTALDAMHAKAKELRVNAKILSDQFQSDADSAGKKLINEANTGEILLTGGETTVSVKGKGEGGRNQQLVLSALSEISEGTIICSFDSDGWDNSPAAGAIGDFLTKKTSKEQNLDIKKFIFENNSFPFFETVGDAILTDRLPSNISDLMIVFKK